MTVHPKAKLWVEVVECIAFPIVVSVLLHVAAGPIAYWQAGVFALVCVACVLPMLFYFCANVTHRRIPALWLSSALEVQRSN
jgi:hypothetical protein